MFFEQRLNTEFQRDGRERAMAARAVKLETDRAGSFIDCADLNLAAVRMHRGPDLVENGVDLCAHIG